jgi:hypothetical protein
MRSSLWLNMELNIGWLLLIVSGHAGRAVNIGAAQRDIRIGDKGTGRHNPFSHTLF